MSRQGLYWGESEWRAARRLGLSRDDYQAVSAELWGRNLSDERDARMAVIAPSDASFRSRAAHRGRITRLLDDEVKRFIAARSGDTP